MESTTSGTTGPSMTLVTPKSNKPAKDRGDRWQWMTPEQLKWLLAQFPIIWTLMSLHSIQHPFMPFYDTPYIYALWVYVAIQPSLQIRSTLAPSNGASCFHHYSRDTAGDSHMIMCEFHRLLLPWMNLGTMVTHHDRFPSPCWIQCVSVATSLSYLLL